MSACSASRWLLTEMYSPAHKCTAACIAAVDTAEHGSFPRCTLHQSYRHPVNAVHRQQCRAEQHQSSGRRLPTAMLSAPPTMPATPLNTIVW
jgi:hypothetical protein